ncbi:aspartate aminotransferase family protein [Entomomonas asaccharolytica]|uniref:Aspartate aminotransferase family protein n=1 Tax=Entomomonas asaccharolytica TaxID=2785331 RepID=A0A974NE52_9GAMM|nr:aspartate aminotransferase family protein [Entomomonas asaccharolytica]QQP85110.1 aspartate aminotransferase family protein [Entomomonas asaccharolytica]
MTTQNSQTAQLQDLGREHLLPPFTDYQQLNAKGARIIKQAKGVYLWDTEGNKILDGMAGLWCVNVGYGRKELAEAAYKQMLELPYYNLFFQTAHPPAIELAKAITELAPEGMNHVFFTGSGSESNDTVVRMVRHYWATKGQPEKQIIISRVNGYHGSTVAGASLSGMPAMHKQGGVLSGIEHIAQPYWYGSDRTKSPEEFGIWAAEQLEQKIQEIGVEKIAAFIAEPIQGAGGVIIPPTTYWPKVREILAKYDILFVADEVICGFGRTGEWFGSQYFGNQPDLMPIAKGITSGYLPMGGVIVRDEIVEVLNQGGEFYHGYTYSGHPASAAVALENINILKNENILEHVKSDIAPYLLEKWTQLADHPLVGEARALGMVGALELVKNKQTAERFAGGNTGMMCREHCFNNGLVMRAVGDTMIIAPPLVITKTEVDELIEKAVKCLDLTWQDAKAK